MKASKVLPAASPICCHRESERSASCGQPLPPREAAALCAKIADAVHHAHEQGVVHRDLKPSNIMMDLDGEPHVMDFGLAKRDSGEITMTMEGAMVGTPAYMSPEQARGKGHDADSRSDIYSLGTVLFELLTAELPFRGDKPMLVVRILTEEPPRLSKLNPRVPKDLETICLKCLEKEPDRRYATARSLADDLRRFLAGEPISARPVGSIEYVLRWCVRHPASAGLIAATSVALMALAALAVGYGYHQRLQLANSQLAESRKALDRVLYFRNTSQALAAWNDDHVFRARRLLDECPEQRRHWEWHYVDRLFSHGVVTLRGHDNWVRTVVFSPGGKLIATGCSREVRVWDAETLKPLYTLERDVDPIHVAPVSFNPSGEQIAVHGEGFTIKIVDAKTGRETGKFGAHTDIIGDIVFSPDGTQIATASLDDSVKLWDVAGGTEILSFEGSDDRFLARVIFSPDGSRIAAISRDFEVRLWTTADGRRLSTFKQQGAVASLAFSPDGARLAITTRNGHANIYDVASGASVVTLTDSGYLDSIAFSPDSDWIIGGGHDHTARIWDANTGKELTTFKGHTDVINMVAVSPDGGHVASASRDHTVKLWNVRRRKGTPILEHDDAVTGLALSSDGQWIVSSSDDNSLTVWNTTSGQKTLTIRPGAHHSRVIFSPDGKQIISGGADGLVRTWDFASGKELTSKPFPGRIFALAFSPDGKNMAVGTGGRLNDGKRDDDTIYIVEAGGGNDVCALRGHTDSVTSVCFSPDGNRVASGESLTDSPAKLKIWDISSGKETFSITTSHTITSVDYSPDGKWIATGSQDNTVRVWDSETGHEIHTMVADSFVNSVAFSPDARRIVAGTARDRVKIWDVESGQEALVIEGHSAGVRCVAFSRDGQRIVSGSFDRTVRIWDAGRAFPPQLTLRIGPND